MRKLLVALMLSIWGFAATAGSVTIAALGDSLTQGYGLPADQGFVPQLETWLAEHGTEARLINAGVSGDTTAGGAARVGWTLTPEVDAMIVALGGNDLLRGIDPVVSRANLDAILGAADAAGVAVLLVAMPAPGNFGAEYRDAFNAIYPDLAAAHGTLLAPSFFIGLTRGGQGMADLRGFFQPDGIHPNAAGVARVVDGLGPHVQQLVDLASGG